jgi:hypothetical protein
VLIFNLYSSNSTNPNVENTCINLTNTHSTATAYLHIFFVDGSSGAAVDSYLRLRANQTASFLASDIDPGVVGHVLVVAVDGVTGWPVSFNHLIGDELVKLSSGHTATLGAEAFAAEFGPTSTLLPGYQPSRKEAQVFFGSAPSGASAYSPAPLVIAVDNLSSPADGNSTLVVINSVGGDLLTCVTPLGPMVGSLHNDAETPFTFTYNSANLCQFKQTVSNSFPRVSGGLLAAVPRGKSGWMQIWSRHHTVAMVGAIINFNPIKSKTTFNGGYNLPKLELMSSCSYTIPVAPLAFRD